MSDSIDPAGRHDRLPLPMLFSLAMTIGLAMVLAAVAQPMPAEPSDPPASSADRSVKPGRPDKLLESIDELRQSQPPADATADQEDQFELDRYRAILSAADRVLAFELSPDQALKAVRAKVDALAMLASLGEKQAAGQARQFVEEAETKPYGKSVDVQRFLLDWRLLAAVRQSDPEAAAAAARQLWPKVQQFLANSSPVPADHRLALLTAALFEQSDQPKLEAEADRTFAAFFRRSHEAWATDTADELEGAARLLTLVGQPMKLEGTLSDGHRFDLSAYRGRMVLVDFWATWCGPCVAELENLKQVYKQYHGRGLEIVGVNLDDSRQELADFLDRQPLPWPVIFDSSENLASHGHPLAKYYGITGIPTLILIDRQGRVVSTHARGEELQKLLTERLGAAE